MNRNVAETVKTLTEPSGASNILPPKTIVVVVKAVEESPLSFVGV